MWRGGVRGGRRRKKEEEDEYGRGVFEVVWVWVFTHEKFTAQSFTHQRNSQHKHSVLQSQSFRMHRTTDNCIMLTVGYGTQN
ncbi:hypothetical protein E2C01_033429 [Portunus trituberculatus]|uniref:Uncharacterized protein n=1 Tax=Portunus trituberculatus TaxID=210409 RepID=A0A5B7F2X0_PORTR|nr:hypothetical protein [Portunus trituberculatus]